MKNGIILETLLNNIKEVIADFLSVFCDLALTIIILLLVIEVIRSAIDIVSGKGFTITIKFLTYIIILVFLVKFPNIYTGFHKGLIEDSGLQENFRVLSTYIKTRHDSNLLNPNPRGVPFYIKFATGIDVSKFNPDYVLRFIFTSISYFICFILLILIIFLIGKKYAVFLIQLALGPVPISLMMTKETRSIGFEWMKSVFSQFMTLFIYSVVLKISHKFILKYQYEIYDHSGGEIGLTSNITPAILLILMVLFLFKIVSDLTSDLLN